MINFHPNEWVAGGVNTAFLSHHARNQALIMQWEQWAREATPTENRTKAVEELIRCLITNSNELNLSRLELTSLPAHLPPCIEILQVSDNQLSELPPLTELRLKTINAANNQLFALPFPLPASLKVLNAQNNELRSLPVLPSSLRRLEIDDNELAWLPELPVSLQYLYASNNKLEQLPPLPARLKYLDVSHNTLERLLQLPTGLRYLNANNNKLERLPPLPARLKYLDASHNSLAQLPSLPTSLKNLYVIDNRLTQLPELPACLQYLDVSDNSLDWLPSLPACLQCLDANNNSLAQLPPLPVSLQYLDVGYNVLNVLPDVLPAQLWFLFVHNNQLRRLPDLPPSLIRINIKNNPFEQPLPAFSASLDVIQDRAIETIVSDFTDNVQPWKAIGKEAYITDFRLFLEQLQAGPNNQDSVVLKQRVGDWLDYLAKEENRALRANTFLIAQEASTSCVDRASFYFNKMYLLMREDQLIKTDTPVVELFNTNLGLFRLQQLEKIATQQAEARSALSSDFKEELEIYLAYECLLREDLSLPIYSELQFSEIAGLTQDDLTRAKQEIKQQEKARFIGYLINESASWQARLTQWDRLQVESMEEAYLDFIGSDDFNQQVNEQLVKDKIDIHDADAYREIAKSEAEALLYQQRYQLTREFLAAQGELALLNGFNRQYAPLDA